MAVGSNIELRVFEAGDSAAFRELNEAWITKLFSLVEHDHRMLNDPLGQIIEPGGQIIVAVEDGRVIGCCALIPREPGVFEMAKLAVAEDRQGCGVGRKVMERTIEEARAMGAKRLYLETNHTLKNTIHLNEALGFRRLPPRTSHYERADVFMEMDL